MIKVLQLLEVEEEASARQLVPLRERLQEGLKFLEKEKMKVKEEKMEDLEDNLEKQLREVKVEEEDEKVDVDEIEEEEEVDEHRERQRQGRREK